MNRIAKLLLAISLAAPISLGAAAAYAQAPAPPAKNWAPPAQKIYAQQLSDQTMAAHPELLSVTLHGVPPGQQNVYTMFAGSYPERIGNPDDPDDIDVTRKGITILDPRWRRTDAIKKFVVLMPLRDAKGQNVGLIVYAFKSPANDKTTEGQYFAKSVALRDALQPKITSYEALFAPVT
ncbi:MAG: hypothetical protein JWQ29_2944 [Phenylobacterium sp.]|nr:hypothetical protein [Phenylobacterium sp.]